MHKDKPQCFRDVMSIILVPFIIFFIKNKTDHIIEGGNEY